MDDNFRPPQVGEKESGHALVWWFYPDESYEVMKARMAYSTSAALWRGTKSSTGSYISEGGFDERTS